MTIGKYKIARQNGCFGLYAVVSLKVKYSKTGLVNVDLHNSVDKKWELSCLDGIKYAYEKIPEKSGVDVEIISLDWNPVDTKPMAVKFVTAMAFWQSLKYEPEQLPKIYKIDSGFQIVFS